MTRRRFGKGEAIFHEGDLGDTLHIISAGHVAIRVSTPMGDVATLTVLSAGEAFGEQAILTPDSRRTASAVSLERTETLSLSADSFRELCGNSPQVNSFLVEVLASQVRRLSAEVLESRHVGAATRVVRRLAELAEVYATDPLASADIAITQDDLASFAGVTRPTANRVLGDLVEEGTIERVRGRLTVLDRERLRSLARRA